MATPELARDFARRHGVPKCYTDVDQLVHEDRLGVGAGEPAAGLLGVDDHHPADGMPTPARSLDVAGAADPGDRAGHRSLSQNELDEEKHEVLKNNNL